VLRRIFGPKRDKTIGAWRKLHNEELCNLYPSPYIPNYNNDVKEDEMNRACSTHGREEECTQVSGEKSKRMTQTWM
jgi:hypothetical protein